RSLGEGWSLPQRTCANRTIHPNCSNPLAALFRKGTSEIRANRRACDWATRPDALLRNGNIFEAGFPSQASALDQECLLSVGTRRSPITLIGRRESNAQRFAPREWLISNPQLPWREQIPERATPSPER